MDRLDLGPLVAMRAPRFGYVRIDANGFLTPAQLGELLADARLGHFLATSGKHAALLNTAGMHRFGTDDVQFIGERWAPLLASIHVRRLSLVVQEQVFALFGQIFAHGAERAAAHGVELRAFPSAQFTQSWESVTWLEPPVAAAPSAAGAGGLMELPHLVDADAWNRADVAGIAFLTPADGPPGLGFIFRDAATGVGIFDGWRRDLGPRDDDDLLRVAIVEGDRPGKPPGYVVTLQPNIEAIVARAAATGGVSLDVRGALGGWAKSMNTPPGGSPHLAAFKGLYGQRGEYALVPVVSGAGGGFEPLYDKQLVKKTLLLRNVRDIAAGDPDAFVLG